MAKVVFLQRDPIEWLGIMYLSSVLKDHGHRTAVVVESLEDRDFTERVLAEDADIFALSPLITDIRWALDRAAGLKAQSPALVALGGTHVTLNPEETLAHPAVDVICRGEGEYPLLEFADAVDAGHDWSTIPNLWAKRGGAVVRNDLRDLIADLDALPFPDRTLYAGYPELQSWGKRPLHMGRGCPYACSYCHNASKRDLYAGKGRHIRWRSVDSVLAEVAELDRATFFKVLHFVDDGFGINRAWFEDFLPRLSALVDEPPAIFANMRADMVTRELCAAFADYGAGRMRLRIAVECGDESYRQQVLNKTISDADLRRAAQLFHEHEIAFSTYNMVGLPGESLEQAVSTLRLNVELRPAEAYCFIYQPFPGTRLADHALDIGAVDAATLAGSGADGFHGTFESFSPLRQDNIVELENVQRLFGLVVKMPALFAIARRLVAVRRLAPVFRLLYQLHLRLSVRRRRRVDAY